MTIPSDTFGLIGEYCGIVVKEDVAACLSQDIEYRLREIVQESLKFMRHSKRTKLTTEDINCALKVRNVERLYGFGNQLPLNFRNISSSTQQENVFFVQDEELDLEDIINGQLPKVPLDIALTAHWLAIEGVQPAIPQNPAAIESRIVELSAKLRMEGKSNLEKKLELKPLVRHIISRELQLYYEKIIETLMSENLELRNAALECLTTDNGIQQLLPYLIQFVTESIAKNLKKLKVIETMVLILEAIMKNPNFFLESYLHQLMPPILSCMVTKRICETPQEDHWAVRNHAAKLMAQIIERFGDSYQTLQPRVTRTLFRAFLDPLKALTCHYGAIIGLTHLGNEVIRLMIIPNVKKYIDMIKQEFSNDAHPIKRDEALKCKDALKIASLLYLKQFAVKDNMIDHVSDLVSVFGKEILKE